jgi:hypothetical protein
METKAHINRTFRRDEAQNTIKLFFNEYTLAEETLNSIHELLETAIKNIDNMNIGEAKGNIDIAMKQIKRTLQFIEGRYEND